MLQDMQRLNLSKPDIRFQRCGRIDINTKAARRMGLGPGSRVSFFLDRYSNLYVRPDNDGLRPIATKGRNCLRFYCKLVTDAVFCLPDVPAGLERAAFRIGQPEDGTNYPVITRRLL